MKRKGVKIILVITVFAIIFYGYRYLKIPVDTQMAKMTQLEDIIPCETYVAREEVVYVSENTGTMYSYVSDGSRVAKNMKIATVYHGDINNNIVQELNNIDNKIAQLKIEKEKDELFTIDKSSVESRLEAIKNDIIAASVNNEIEKMREYKNRINSLYNKDVDTIGDSIDKLQQRKSEIENELGSNKSDIYSSISGIFSKNTDGLETVLTPDAIMNYTLLDFNGLVPPESTGDITNSVNFGDKVCKVVDNHTWYAVTKLPKADAEMLKKKKNLTVRFDNLPGDEVKASIVYISEESEEEENAVVVFKSDRYLEGVYGIRYGKMEIVVNRYVGFEVPVYSLRVVNGETGVLISKGTSEVFCKCDVVYTDDKNETAIIYPADDAKVELTAGDKIILGEKTS